MDLTLFDGKETGHGTGKGGGELTAEQVETLVSFARQIGFRRASRRMLLLLDEEDRRRVRSDYG